MDANNVILVTIKENESLLSELVDQVASLGKVVECLKNKVDTETYSVITEAIIDLTGAMNSINYVIGGLITDGLNAKCPPL